MSQNDFTIANQGFPAFRADLNSALQALASNSSGATEPSTTFANMWWYDSANDIMYIRNEDNDAWIKFAELDQTNDKFVLSGTLQLDDGTVSAPALTFNSDTNMGIYRGGTDILKFVTAGTDAVTIDASQNVGIGVSPDTVLHIKDANPIFKIEDNNETASGSIRFFDSVRETGQISVQSGASALMAFNVIGSEAMRIDSSGNLLVGQTTNGITSTGIGFVPNGVSHLYTVGERALELGRGSDDGEILRFNRSGTTVGSIGVTTSRLTIGTGDTGLRFHATSDFISPWNTSTNGARDGAIDLGGVSDRFKDLYLSGGVYLGGTGSDNYLDDYEEGTFTMSVSTSGYTLVDQAGFYTKIGRKVTVVGFVKFDPVGSNNSAVTLGGLPFVSASLDNDIAYVGSARESVVAGDIFVAQVTRGTSTFGINSMDGVGSGQNQIFVANRNIVFNITYFV